MKLDLEEWLEAVQVGDIPDTDESNEPAVKYLQGWYSVSTDDDGGIVAYFRDEEDAYRFRFDYINGQMNPVRKSASEGGAE